MNATVVQPSLEVIEKPKEMVDFHALVRSTVQTENQQNEGIFTCSNDGCMSSFNTHQELHDNAILDECNVQSEKIKKSDMLKTQYIKNCLRHRLLPKKSQFLVTVLKLKANKLCLKAGELNWKGKTKDSLKTKRVF